MQHQLTTGNQRFGVKAELASARCRHRPLTAPAAVASDRLTSTRPSNCMRLHEIADVSVSIGTRLGFLAACKILYGKP
jgi:hypothetical protein